MRRPSRSLVLVPLVALALAGCSSNDSAATSSASDAEAETTAQTVAVSTAAEAAGDNVADHDEDADYLWDADDEIAVTLDGVSASSESAAVVIDGATVTITAAGTYRLTGALTDGQIVVDSADDGIVRIVFDGVTVANSATAPVVITNAAKAMIVLADGTTNSVSDAGTYTYPDAETDEPDAAIFSADDLTITGSGSLDVEGNFADGIASKDGLVITGGRITVNAVDDGIRGKDYLVVRERETSPSIDVVSGGDGLKSSNADDTTVGYTSIEGGTISIVSAGDGSRLRVTR